MVLVLSLVIAQSIVASLAGPVAIPAPFPGGKLLINISVGK